MSCATTGSTCSRSESAPAGGAAAQPSPCLDCGACCASFRVSFYWGESDEHPGGTVPAALTTPVAPMRLAMRGTDRTTPRCTALDGEIGRSVSCRIYARRPSPCREFNWHGEQGERNERCNRARQRHGLPLLPDPL